MNYKNLEKLVSEALEIEARDAKEAGALGYMARALVQATLPHSKPKGNEFQRKNGAFKLTILAPSDIGLPYGSYPRLLIAWMSTEAVKKKERTLVLGSSLSEFMHQLDLIPSGGRWGTIFRLKDQMTRLFSSYITCSYEEKIQGKIIREAGKSFTMTSAHDLWWSPQTPSQVGLWESTVTLGEEFFKEVTTNAIPIDIRALKALKGSSMRLDIYQWLTFRMSYLPRKTIIPWPVLAMQFGSEFSRHRDFKAHFKDHLRAVQVVYPEAKIGEDESTGNLILYPSPPHILPK